MGLQCPVPPAATAPATAPADAVARTSLCQSPIQHAAPLGVEVTRNRASRRRLHSTSHSAIAASPRRQRWGAAEGGRAQHDGLKYRLGAAAVRPLLPAAGRWAGQEATEPGCAYACCGGEAMHACGRAQRLQAHASNAWAALEPCWWAQRQALARPSRWRSAAQRSAAAPPHSAIKCWRALLAGPPQPWQRRPTGGRRGAWHRPAAVGNLPASGLWGPGSMEQQQEGASPDDLA